MGAQAHHAWFHLNMRRSCFSASSAGVVLLIMFYGVCEADVWDREAEMTDQLSKSMAITEASKPHEAGPYHQKAGEPENHVGKRLFLKRPAAATPARQSQKAVKARATTRKKLAALALNAKSILQKGVTQPKRKQSRPAHLHVDQRINAQRLQQVASQSSTSYSTL